MEERRYKCDLKSNLFAAQTGRARHAFRQADRLVEVPDCLDIRRAMKRLVARLFPPFDRLLIADQRA